jgi:beta-phosphoglucomutase
MTIGAIFDWDGVLIDSSSHHEESWRLLAAEQSKVLPEGFFKATFGMKNEEIIPRFLGWAEDTDAVRTLSLRKEELYRDVVREQGIEPLPGVQAWLQELKQREVPCIIASSTHRENIRLSLDLLGLSGMFVDMVTSEDVTLGKPHPQVFLKAAEVISMPPAQCIVFEDAHVGIEAARAAGMAVVALSTTHPAESLRDADLIVASLAELSFGQVSGLLS